MANPAGWTSLVQKNVLDENGDALTPRGAMAVESPDGSVTVELVDDATDKVTRIKLSAGPGQGLRPVRLAATENLNLAPEAILDPEVDGVAVNTGDRILLALQTDQTEDGPYVATVGELSMSLARATDMAAGSTATPGVQIAVQAGDTWAGSTWTLRGDGALTVGTDALVFASDNRFGALVAALRATPGTEGETRWLAGYSTAGDGGEGPVRYSGTAATDDDGTIFNVGGFGTSAAGWRRTDSGPLNPCQFGASVGASATTNTLAINRALLAAYGGLTRSRSVRIPRVTLDTNGIINVFSTKANPVELYGEGVDSCINATIAGNNAIAMAAQGSVFAYCTLRDFAISGQFARALSLSASSGDHVFVKRLDLSGATFDNGDAGTTIATLAVGGLDDVWIEENHLHDNGKDIAPRVTVTADSGTDFFTANAHGFLDGEFVSFENSGGALPGGIAADTEYVIRDKTANTFKVAATVGGAAIDLTTNGTGTTSVFYRLGKGYEFLKTSGTLDSRIHFNRNKIVGHKTAMGASLFDCADSEAVGNEIDQGNTAADDDPNFTFGYGLFFYDSMSSGLAVRNKALANKISNCAGIGIYLEECWDSDVSGANQIFDVCKQIDEPSLPLAGIVANGCDATISGNTVIRSGRACVAITYPGTPVLGNKLSGSANNAAISFLGDADGASIVGNIVADCAHGIMANNTNPSGITVLGNVFTDVAAPISEQGTGSFEKSTFAKNKATGAQIGFYMLAGNDNDLDGNTVEGSDSWGIQVGGDRNTVTRNTVTGSAAQGGIQVSGADCRVHDNTATGNTGVDIDTSTATRVERLRNRLTGEVTEDVGGDNVACTAHASGSAANGSQFDAITWTPPDDSTYIVTATVKLKKAGVGVEALILAASYDTTSGTTTLQGPAAGAQATFHQPNTQAWAAELGLATNDVALKLTLAASCAWEVKLQIDRLDA